MPVIFILLFAISRSVINTEISSGAVLSTLTLAVSPVEANILRANSSFLPSKSSLTLSASIPENKLAYGNPIKVIKDLKKEEVNLYRESVH